MDSFWVWGMALAAYGLFLAWYVNWRGPLKPQEIDDLMARITAHNPDAGRNDPAVVRHFLEGDDGREFFMLNLVRVASTEVADPLTGQMRPARAVMDGYTRMFLPALFRRGGHPAIAARKIGPYFDAWGVEPDPEWTLVGYMRYRSRRDLAILVADPRFGGAHDFKFAAMPQTFSFPTRPVIMALASPKLWLGLAIALIAALTQIALLLVAVD
ncbi:hypothetical protein [Phenylobacterium aquaticum]|uniref:hypothetical protein n=1 Tax=Phenylobacterium aquaticum TaxID=1763816 RepID=UPI0026F18A75|nr:hypothetical protein [Phenylobacterium aquaticum]